MTVTEPHAILRKETHKIEKNRMRPEQIRVWWDGEGDFLYVAFADGDGDMVRTQGGKAMVKVDADRNVIGFQLTRGSKRGKGASPLSVKLTPADEASPAP